MSERIPIWECKVCEIGLLPPCYLLGMLPTKCPEKHQLKNIIPHFTRITHEEFTTKLEQIGIIHNGKS